MVDNVCVCVCVCVCAFACVYVCVCVCVCMKPSVRMRSSTELALDEYCKNERVSQVTMRVVVDTF